MLETQADRDRMSKVEKKGNIYFEKKEKVVLEKRVTPKVEVIEEVVEEIVEDVVKEVEEINVLRETYEAKLGKPVPNNKKNDSEWIANKIAE